MLACQARLASEQAAERFTANNFCPSERRLQLQNSAKGDAGFSNQGGSFHFGSSNRVKPRETASHLSASKRIKRHGVLVQPARFQSDEAQR
jgi:hypothetical protein